MFCRQCGTQVSEGTAFCHKCGTSINPSAQEQPQTQYQAPQQQQQQQQHHFGGNYYPQQKGFLADIYAKAFGFLFKKPIHLWGLSLLHALLVSLALIFGFIPLFWIPIVLVLNLGMASVFLTGYRGSEISASQLFSGFNKNFFRNAGGMGWRGLWILIWGLIPLAGLFIAIVKSYAYRFVPYIMLNDPEIKATEALKKSIMQTSGYKGKMFIADLLVILGIFVIGLIIGVIMLVPIIGWLIGALLIIALYVLLPLTFGVLEAAYYDKVIKDNPDRE